VRNDVLGTGLSVFDNSSTYGSKGRLQGISVFPISSLFDGAETAYQHELAHQWWGNAITCADWSSPLDGSTVRTFVMTG
jgi:hypothetical protein